MNNLDHVKNFYPDNYKLDLSETMKAALSKGPNASGVCSVAGSSGGGVGGSGSASTMGAPHTDMLPQGNANLPGVGYVTEKLYMLLQLYLQNKGWNPSAELLQCFTDLKDNAMLPSAAYLQVLANRLTLDSQGRLILRENGKIVLPFEHFANAVMLKHMSGPHGLHLSVDATVRAVIESYTIGRDQFGMEKEFIIEVVQSCPSPACRYYKNHMGISPLPFMDQQFPGVNTTDFLQHLPHLPPPPPHQIVGNNSGGSSGGSSAATSVGGSSSVGSVGSSSGSGGMSANTSNSSGNGGIEIDLSKASQSKVPPQLQHLTKQQQNSIQSQLSQISAAAAAAHHQQQLQQQQQQQQQQAAAAKHQQQLTAALIQQQNRVLAQQSLEKFSSLSAIEKQRVLAQLDPKHFDPMAVAAAAANLQIQGLMQSQAAAAAAAASQPSASSSSVVAAAAAASVAANVAAAAVANASANSNHHGSSGGGGGGSSNVHVHQLPPPSQSPHSVSSTSSSHSSIDQLAQKNIETLRSNLDSLESNKDLLALHNGAWGAAQEANRAAAAASASGSCGVSGSVGGSSVSTGGPNGGGAGVSVCLGVGVNTSTELTQVGQDKIVRIFAELMRNMARMKTYIRPSMCKPYGKQSESLQKTLMDTIQIVQTLRNCLPAPHIPVTSWKSESEGSGVGAGVGPAGLSLAANGSLQLGAGVPTLGLQATRVDNMH